MQSTKTPPTNEAYGELQGAFDHFNLELFAGTLPACLITLQREKRTYGYYLSERFVNEDGRRADEIAMNPAYFASTAPTEVMSTLVHEMVHLWQFHFGERGRRSYHNVQWADKMESIGLMPSDTGVPGGRRVGEKMNHYSIAGGPFERACGKLLTGNFRISWRDRFQASTTSEEVGGKSNRSKYTCPTCNINVWGKPGLGLLCRDCQEVLVPV